MLSAMKSLLSHGLFMAVTLITAALKSCVGAGVHPSTALVQRARAASARRKVGRRIVPRILLEYRENASGRPADQGLIASPGVGNTTLLI